jgi:hypothetical protein
MSDQQASLTYGNWRRPQSPGVAGLGLLGTGVLVAGMVLVIVLLTFSIAAAGIGVVALAAVMAPLLLKDRHGRNGIQRLSARVSWAQGRGRGWRNYRSGPVGRARSGRFQLPGLGAQMTAVDATDAFNRPFVLLHHPGTGHVSTVIETSPDGNALVDEAQVDQWVAHWGAWLSALGQETGLVGASVTIETAPDSGTRLDREVNGHLAADAPALARQVMAEVVRDYPSGSASITCRIALTWTLQTAFGGSRRRSVAEMAIEIGNRLPGLTQPLVAAGGGVAEPMTTATLAAAIRVAYDPQVHALVDEAGAANAGIAWEDAGPSAAQEAADHYWHDGAMSVTWAMSGAPRGLVFSNVLAKLLAPHRDISRKRVTLLYRPHDAARSAELVERDRRDALFAAQGGGRRGPSARNVVSVQAAEQAAREEARGAGLTRFGMMVTATVIGADRDTVRQVESTVDSLGTASRIVLRRLWGSQSAGFLAALPLGLVIPAHLKVPASVREAM